MKLKELEKRLTKEPGNLGLRVQVAGVLREAGRSVEAVEHYRFVALAYRDQGRAQQAIAVCRNILEIAPEDSACQGLLAMLQGRTAPSRPAIDEIPVGRSAKSPTVPPLSRAATNSSGPVSVPSVPSLQRPTTVRAPSPSPEPRPPSQVPVARPTPEERPLSRTTDPTMRRSSLIDMTPLPNPLPYHLADRTSQPNKLSSPELDLPLSEGAETRPGNEDRRSESTTTTGLAQAARRISGLISDSRGAPSSHMDLAAELDTRQRARIAPEQLQKIDRIPTSPVDTQRERPRDTSRDTSPVDMRERPRDTSRDTSPVDMRERPRDTSPRETSRDVHRDTSRDVQGDRAFIDRLELDDLTTPPPAEDVQTEQVRVLTPIPRGSEDALTPPPMQPRRASPSVPPPAKRPTPLVPAPAAAPVMRPSPSVPSLRPAQRGNPSVPPLVVPRGNPSVPPPIQRGNPSVPPPIQRGKPSVPPPAPQPQRGAPSVPPPHRGPAAAPPSQMSTTLRGVAPIRPSGPPLRPTPTSLPPPPSSSGSPSRPQLVVAIPPRGESSGRTSSRPSILTMPTRGTKSNPPSDVDDELTQPRDRLGIDDDD